MLNGSNAVTVKLKVDPAVADAGGETERWFAAPALTATVLLVPVIDTVTLSVPEIVLFPAVRIVALKVPTPLVSVELEGSDELTSVLEKCTVPA